MKWCQKQAEKGTDGSVTGHTCLMLMKSVSRSAKVSFRDSVLEAMLNSIWCRIELITRTVKSFFLDTKFPGGLSDRFHASSAYPNTI